jgi:hypothetical protein
MRINFTPALMLAAGFVGCATQAQPVDDAKSGLNISARAPGTIEGTFRAGDTAIAFSSVAVDDVATIKFDFGDATVTYVQNHAIGSGSVTPTGAITAAEHEAALGMVNALGEQFIQEVSSEEDLPLNEFMLSRMASHLASAPVGPNLINFKFENQRDVRYLPCNRQYNWVYQYYTGTWYNLLTGQGGVCEGRCGVGCGWDDTYWFRWGTGVYSQDCALHDNGLQDWAYAVDDYAASSNCKSGI